MLLRYLLLSESMSRDCYDTLKKEKLSSLFRPIGQLILYSINLLRVIVAQLYQRNHGSFGMNVRKYR